MTETSRRVNITLTAATDEYPHQVMAGVLDAVRNALPDLAIQATSAHAFDLTEDGAEPEVQLVLRDSTLDGTYVDDPTRADEHAQNIGGVVVALPINADFRRKETDHG